MLITIKGEERYIPVWTITLQKVADGVTFPFHCLQCGNTLNVIGGKVTKIYPILEPSDQIPVISKCKSCNSRFVFQDGEPEMGDSVRVLLPIKPETQPFYCYLGGGSEKNINKVLDYDARQIFSYSETRYRHTPFTTVCPNPSCSISYHFTRLS